MLTREEYENLINNSPLFEVDKESSPALYQTERYKFITVLTDYYRFYVYPKKPLDEYSMTLLETANECVKYYDKSKAEFLHLFNGAMKRDLHIARAKEVIEEKRHGIRIGGEDERLIRKIIAFANSKNLDINDATVQGKIAQALNMPFERLQDLLMINNDAIAVSSTVANEDGDEIALFDLQVSHEKTAEDRLSEESGFIILIERINAAFLAVQDRQKRLLSMLLTVEIVKALEYEVEKINSILRERELFNAEVMEYYFSNGELPTAKQIGIMCGVSEQSLSRTYKNFKEKIR